MKQLFDQSSYKVAKLITNEYSTSFSLGIRLFKHSIRPSIYAIYGFVRYADEIVDSFNEYDQASLLSRFIKDYKLALAEKISLNPVLNAFQEVVNDHDIDPLVDKFLESMTMDLHKESYQTEEEYKNYIYGSADVVGLMCLKVFVQGDEAEYNRLKPYAISLGSAFQKVNFLRDIKHDMDSLGRSYFPNVDFVNFTDRQRNEIIAEIKKDFEVALKGIKQLPPNSRLGVYVAYKYYLSLLNKLSRKKVEDILAKRIRISNYKKLYLLKKAFIRYKLNIL